MTHKPGQVIVGASAAGVSAAVAMRAAGYEGTITVIDSDPHQPYERPPLSKGLLGDLDDHALKPILPEDAYGTHDIELRLGTGVTKLDLLKRHVILDEGEALPAAHVLLATGVAARRLPVPGADLSNILTLRNAEDALALSARLALGGPLVIIGGGFIGLELAAVARENGVDVTVVEVAALPLIGVTGHTVAELITRLHTERGVHFRLGATVTAFLGTSAVEAVQLDDGQRLPARTVIVGVGVLPRVALAQAAGITTDRFGIVVDRLGNSSHGWVSAAGDVASQPHPALPTPGRIEHWDVALRHGAAVGASVVGTSTPFVATPYAWSCQYGLTLQMFGRAHPRDQIVLRRGATPERFLSFWLREGRVGAVAGLDASRDVLAVRRLIEGRGQAHEEQLKDPDVDLRRLVHESTTAE